VTITGSNFLAGALVLFGSVSAPAVTVTSSTLIQVVTPSNAAGAVDVTVENTGNLSAKLTGGFTYESATSGPPTITSVSPTSGTPGTQVTITGTNFESGATVTFGSTAASAVFVSATQLTASVPSVGTGTYSLTVTNPDPASAMLNSGFTVTAAQSLLAGMTPSNYKVPSGWSLVLTEDFESGSIGPNEFLGQNASGNPAISTTRPHTGSKSLQCAIGWNGAGCDLGVVPGAIGSSNHIYISYWRQVDPNACAAVEAYFAEVYTEGSGGGTGFMDEMDNDNYSSNPTCPAYMTPRFYGDGAYMFNDAPTQGTDVWYLPRGVWEQVEFEFKGSTCTGSTSNNDGLYRLWVNGTLTAQHVNFNTSGCAAGYNSAGMGIRNGGVWTQLNGANPANGTFNVYLDDVIVLMQ
jgi:IPT/TIG domain